MFDDPDSFHLIRIQNSAISSEPEKSADILRRHHWFPRQMTSEKRAQKFHTDDASLQNLGSAFDRSFHVGNLLQPIRSTIQIWVVMCHQYGIFVFVSHTSFRGKQVVACRNVACVQTITKL